MNEKKIVRFLFCVVALIACVQLSGLEEAFCEDSATEAGCQECMTCAGHLFTEFSKPALLPSIVPISHVFQIDPFWPKHRSPLSLLRPPIAL